MSIFPPRYTLLTSDGEIPVKILRESILTISVIGVNPAGYDEKQRPLYHKATLNKKMHKNSLFRYGVRIL